MVENVWRSWPARRGVAGSFGSLRWLVAAAVVALVAACGSAPAASGDGGADGASSFETRVETCDDAVDNDGDGDIDCADGDCLATALGGPSSSFADSIRFLSEGTTDGFCSGAAHQTSVSAGALPPSVVAVVQGRVVAARDGSPVAGATVSVAGHPDTGFVRTDGAGQFVLVVRGGPGVTLDVASDPFLPVQRTLEAVPGRYSWAGTIALTVRDSAATVIRFGAAGAQLHRATEIRDDDGRRRATLLFPAGVRATVTRGGATSEPSQLTIRATEYTVGATGRRAMPGTLPARSGYTYAVELDADEAPAASSRIDFDAPVAMFVENFVGFEVGTHVPLGYYDRQLARWVAHDDGNVIAILGRDADGATIDVDGDGAAESGVTVRARLHLTVEGIRLLGGLYPAGTQLWHVSVDHFTPWDCNWPYGPPDGALYPDGEWGPLGRSSPCERAGSIIECEPQVLGQTIPLIGVGQALHYRSDRVPGRIAAQQIEVPTDSDLLPSGVQEVEIQIDVAGWHVETTRAPAPGAMFRWSWSGLDRFGRAPSGMQVADVRVRYAYVGQYREPGSSSPSFGAEGGVITAERARGLVTLETRQQVRLGVLDARGVGLGGFTLDGQHMLDRAGRQVLYGDGRRADLQAVSTQVSRQGLAAVGVLAWLPGGDVVSSSSVGVGSGTSGRLQRIGPNGTANTIAGGVASATSTGDGGPALAARFRDINALAAGSDGTIYLADGALGFDRSCVRKIDPSGIITLFAGICSGRVDTDAGDGGPATSATFGLISSLAVERDGAVLVGDFTFGRVRRIRTDGVIEAVAGGGTGGLNDVAAPDASFPEILSIAHAADGSIYVALRANIARIVGARVFTVVGTGLRGFDGDGKPGVASAIDDPASLAIAPNGEVCFADSGNSRIRCFDSVTTIVETLVGGGASPAIEDWIMDPSLRALGTRVHMGVPVALVIGPEGSLVYNDLKLLFRGSLPFWTGADGEVTVPTEDGSLLHVFDGAGRHLRTIETVDGRTLVELEYDPDGSLRLMRDQYGYETRIERSADGIATAIIAPFGQRNDLEIDARGWLRSVGDSLGGRWMLDWTDDGLLQAFSDPAGGVSTFVFALGRLVTDRRADDGATITLARVHTSSGDSIDVAGPRSGATESYALTYAATQGSEDRAHVHPDGLVTATLAQDTDGDRRTALPDGTVIRSRLSPDPRFGMFSPFVSRVAVEFPDGRTSVTEQSIEVVASATDHAVAEASTRRLTLPGSRTYVESWDRVTRTMRSTTPGGFQTTQRFDAFGRLAESVAPGRAPVLYDYHPDGALFHVRTGVGLRERVWTYEYEDGAVLSMTDPLLRTVALERDVAMRPERIVAGARAVSVAYDGVDRPTSIAPPSRPAHKLTYTPSGAFSAYAPPAGGDPLGTTTVTHDEAQYASSIVSGGRGTGYERDPRTGRLQGVTLARGRFDAHYDALGRLDAMEGPDGARLEWAWDGPLLSTVRASGVASGEISFEHDPATFEIAAWTVVGTRVAVERDADGVSTRIGDLVFTRDPVHGEISTVAVGSTRSVRTLDDFGEITRRTFTRAGTTVYDEQVLGRDALGRVLRVRETVLGVSHVLDYAYDVADRLSDVQQDAAPVEHYQYDPNGARQSFVRRGESGSATVSPDDRPQTHGARTFTYLADGSRQTAVDPAGSTRYDLDEVGTLLGVVLPDGRRIDYDIDPVGRRVGRRVDGVLTTGWLYFGDLAPVAETNAAGVTTTVFVTGPGAMTPELMIRAGARYRFVTDMRGSVRLVIDEATGAVVQRIDYDAFGRVLSDTSPGFQPFGFAGGLYDPDTQLVRFGARDYDADTGTWLSADPSAFGGGLNFYDYAGGDPVNRIDVNGEWWFLLPLVEGAVGAVGMGFGIRGMLHLAGGGSLYDCMSTENLARDMATDAFLGASTAGLGVIAADGARAAAGSRGLGGACRGGACTRLGAGEFLGVGEYLAAKAPRQVTPGMSVLEGQYMNDLGRVEPWRAHYDGYGRMIGRTDFNAGNAAQGIPSTHHHIYDWSLRGAPGQQVGRHLPGEYGSP